MCLDSSQNSLEFVGYTGVVNIVVVVLLIVSIFVISSSSSCLHPTGDMAALSSRFCWWFHPFSECVRLPPATQLTDVLRLNNEAVM